MWGRTFVDSWLVFPAPLEVRGSARKGVQLFWPTVSSWARGKGTLHIWIAGGHLCSLLTRPLGTPPPRTLLIYAFSSCLSCLLVAQTPPCRNGAAVSRAVPVRAACKRPRCPPCRHRRSPRYPTRSHSPSRAAQHVAAERTPPRLAGRRYDRKRCRNFRNFGRPPRRPLSQQPQFQPAG
jgi:hypothetical protein